MGFNVKDFFLSLCVFLGRSVINLSACLGGLALFGREFFSALYRYPLKTHKVFHQMEIVGIDSLIIVALTGTFTGAVLALQSYTGFKRYGGTELIGPLIALSMTRELGPVITGLMVVGRAGSAMAAELGTMRITEQIDALRTLNINPFEYLIIPRIIASTFIVPFLTLFSMVCGIIGGYCVCVYFLGLSGQQYIDGIRNYLEFSDISSGLIKSLFFGFIMSLVGCYKGYQAEGGAQGVGISTTQSVVMGSILTLMANYFLTSILF